MLKNLDIVSIMPSGIMAMLAQAIHKVDIANADSMFSHYETGVYRHDGFKFNFDVFIEGNCINSIKDKWVAYGVCDNYKQILEHYKELLNSEDKSYVIGLSTVNRKDEPEDGGWRWGGWGKYIGTQNPQHEYIYNDTHIDTVYCYHIYEIE